MVLVCAGTSTLSFRKIPDPSSLLGVCRSTITAGWEDAADPAEQKGCCWLFPGTLVSLALARNPGASHFSQLCVRRRWWGLDPAPGSSSEQWGNNRTPLQKTLCQQECQGQKGLGSSWVILA